MTPDNTTEAAGESADADATSEAAGTEAARTEESTEAAGSTDTGTETADDAADTGADDAPQGRKRGVSWSRVTVFGLLPALVLLLAGAAGFLKFQDSSMRAADNARLESMQAAKDGTIAMLAYQPDTVEKDLNAARDRLTGKFRESYTSLIHDVVIPGAKQKKISAVVSVPAVASVSASPSHAVALVFVNQTILVGTDPPSATASSVRVTLDKIGGHWLISDFTPV